MARLLAVPPVNPNPIIEVDLAGIIHFCNPAAERLFPGLCQGKGTSAACRFERVCKFLPRDGVGAEHAGCEFQ